MKLIWMVKDIYTMYTLITELFVLHSWRQSLFRGSKTVSAAVGTWQAQWCHFHYHWEWRRSSYPCPPCHPGLKVRVFWPAAVWRDERGPPRCWNTTPGHPIGSFPAADEVCLLRKYENWGPGPAGMECHQYISSLSTGQENGEGTPFHSFFFFQ